MKLAIQENMIPGKTFLEKMHRAEEYGFQAIEIVKKVNSTGIRVMADSFHMSIEEARIDETIEKGKDFIHHIHLADSNRLLPGYGHTDFKPGFTALKEIGYRKYMALECRIHGSAEK